MTSRFLKAILVNRPAACGATRFLPERWALIVGCVLLAGCAEPGGPDADLVLIGGRVNTLDGDSRVAEAVAVRGDRVVAVGTVAEVEAMAGPETRRVDLEGRAVTPGLMDAHVHFASGGANRIYNLDMSYPNVENIADVQAMVAERAGLAGRKGRVGARRRLGRGQAGGAALHPRVRSRRRGRRAARVARCTRWATTERGELARPRPGRHHGGHPRSRRAAPSTATMTGQPTGVLKESAMGLVTRLIPRRSDPASGARASARLPTPSTPSA